MLDFQRTATHEEVGPITLDLDVIPDLDQAMDQLTAELERRGLTRDPASFDLCPYFGVVWPSARALALELARAGSLAGTRVLELGCGLALPSLVAAKLGAAVTANDFHPEVLRFLASNAAKNGVEIAYEAFDWRSSPAALGEFDLVLASDLLYDASHARPLAATLLRHVAPEGRILIADPGRPHLDACLAELRARGLRQTERVHTVAPTPSLGRAPKEVEVFVIELGLASEI